MHGDERGFFFESFNQKTFNEATGLNENFVQDNHSKSSQGVLRGLHYQLQNTQGKLSNDVLRIGVLTDISGVYADISGKGAVEAVKMAVEDLEGYDWVLLDCPPSLGVLTVAPTTEAAEPMAGASLEALRTSIPAMRALPLLRRVAAGQGGDLVLDYLAPMQLRVGWQPC